MTDTERNARIDALTATATAAWARFVVQAVTHGVWSTQAETAFVAANKAEDAVETTAREYRMEMER